VFGSGIAAVGEGEGMFKQTIRFESAQDAFVFDQHMMDFLRLCDEDSDVDPDACVFTTRLQEEHTHVRVVQTDSADLLGRFLSFLSVRGFPPGQRTEDHRFALHM
jgi:hypothetical protein